MTDSSRRCTDCNLECESKWIFVGRCPKCEIADRDRHLELAVMEIKKATKSMSVAAWMLENAVQHLGG